MPNLLAHRLLMQECIKDTDLDADTKSTLLLATQGPDPLFYYGLMPWRAWHYLAAKRRYGSKIHHTDGKKFFTSLFKSYDEITDEQQKKIFLAFILGQYAHHLLDKNAHPFVYYYSGFNEEGRLKGRFHYEHANFESEIDSCLADIYPEIDFRDHTEDALKTDKKILHAIDKPLKNAMKDFLNVKVSKRYYTNSVKNMISMQKMSNHRWIRKITGKHSMFNALYTDDEYSKDPLNLKHQTWYHPVTNEKRNDSFLDILNKVKEEFKEVVAALSSGSFTKELILSKLDGIDYNGCTEGTKLTYWKEKENKDE